jgi:hypothetical protein
LIDGARQSILISAQSEHSALKLKVTLVITKIMKFHCGCQTLPTLSINSLCVTDAPMGVKIQRAALGWSRAPFGKIKSMICPRRLKKKTDASRHAAVQKRMHYLFPA